MSENKPNTATGLLNGLAISNKFTKVDSCLQLSTSQYLNRPDHDKNIFVGLPFEIWTQIFRYARALCECNIKFVTVNHTKRSKKPDPSIEVKKDFLTCAMKKTRHVTGSGSFKRNDHSHKTYKSLQRVSRKARYMILKATFLEASCHLGLASKEDVKAFAQTMQGLTGTGAPFTHHLKRLHVRLKAQCVYNSFGELKANEVYKDFCQYFCNNLKGHVMHFSFGCKRWNLDLALDIMHDMRGNVEMLKSCNIYLECRAGRELDSLPIRALGFICRRIILNATKDRNTKGVFRFMDLPEEIREMVLQDLLIFDADIPTRIDSMGTVLHERFWRKDQSGATFRCTLCSILKNPSSQPLADSLCFCPQGGGAFFVSSSCFHTPLPVFLASRYMHIAGRRIFYSRNTFRIIANISFDSYQKRPGLTRGIPTAHMKRIRHLHLVASPLDNILSLSAYVRFANFIRSELRLKSLDITFDPDPVQYEDCRYGMTYVPNATAQSLRSVLSHFDDLEGGRPKWYQRTM